jgi:C4-dicarboxylate-specific signal transduction histidine kinase
MGLLFLRADPEPVAGAGTIDSWAGSLWITDEQGQTLFESVATPPRNSKATIIPSALNPVSSLGSQGGAFIELPGAHGVRLAYVTERPLDPDRRLIFVLAQSDAKSVARLGGMGRNSLVGMVALFAAATLLVGVLIRRQTRSLSVLAVAADAIAMGNFQVDLPAADSSQVGSLVRAFRHMVAEVGRREEELAALNLELERRVEDRAAELAREHALERLILDSVADGVVVADRSGRFVLWNRKAEQIIGAGPESVPLERWSEHFGVFRDESGAPFPSEQLPLVRAINGESIDNLELYLRNPRRAEGRWAQVTARPLRDQEGVLSGAVAVMVDVTEQRRLQARLQAHRAELAKFGRLYLGSEIASSTAHQLSQPLGALCNYAGAALRMHQQGRLGESDLGEMLARIEQLSVQAGDILNRLRARIRRNETPPALIDVDAVATSCLDFLEERIQREGVRVERPRVAGLPPILGDPLQLEHALIQLVANALEAMERVERKERRLTLGAAYEPVEGLVTIEIVDTGPGVRAELAERLFRPWETDKPGALGIGLSVVQTTIESLGGRIRMEPGGSRGTRFWIELPVAAGHRA